MTSDPPSSNDSTPEGTEAPTLRQLVIDAGLEVLERDGLSLATRSLSYAKVFAHLEREHGIKVTRASVHERIWASHADFRRDVLAEAISQLPTHVFGSYAHELQAYVADLYARGLDADERVAEVSCAFAPLTFEIVRQMPALRDVQMAKAVASPFNDPLTTEALRGSLRHRADTMLSTVSARISAIVIGLGLQPRQALGLHQTAACELAAVVALNTFVGALLDVEAGSSEITEPVSFRRHPHTGDGPWTMLGIAMYAVLTRLFEDSGRGGATIPLPPPPGNVAPPIIDGGDGSRRRPRHELRELVLGAGVEVLLQERLNLRPESLSYASVFGHIEQKHGVKVYRSSVHKRIWSSHDDYWLDVVTRGIYSDPNVNKAAVDQLMAYTPPSLADGSIDIGQAARDILRLVTAAEVAEGLRSADFLRRQSIKAALLTEPRSSLIASLREAISDTQRERVARHCQAVRDHVVALGFEVRPELGIDEDEALRILVTLSLTAVTGAIFDQSAGVEAVARTYPIRRADGEHRTDDWTAPSLAAWAYFDLLFQERRAATSE
jgi:hypothetical protein